MLGGVGMKRGEELNQPRVLSSFFCLFVERTERKYIEGAMLCASVTVTPQSIDKTLDSLLYLDPLSLSLSLHSPIFLCFFLFYYNFIFFSLSFGLLLLLFRVNAFIY